MFWKRDSGLKAAIPFLSRTYAAVDILVNNFFGQIFTTWQNMQFGRRIMQKLFIIQQKASVF